MLLLVHLKNIVGFSTVPNHHVNVNRNNDVRMKTSLRGMRRPILDQIASTIFKLEMDRVDSSSVTDDKGRVGEPMEWAAKDSMSNRFSEIMAGNGYKFKQWVADIVAGEYDEAEVEAYVNQFIAEGLDSGKPIAMFSFTTCPFCRGAKDYFDQNEIEYIALELDELDGNMGNEVRAVLGKMTRRTSVPSIFLKGKSIGGLNDGTPGLIPLAESGDLNKLLLQ